MQRNDMPLEQHDVVIVRGGDLFIKDLTMRSLPLIRSSHPGYKIRCAPPQHYTPKLSRKKPDFPGLVEMSRILLERCTLCIRECGVNRIRGERGTCGLGTDAYITQDPLVLINEEAVFNPSCKIPIGGCGCFCTTCLFSPDYLIQHKPLTPEVWNDVIGLNASEYFSSIEFCGGEPDINVFGILQLMNKYDNLLKDKIFVWKSSVSPDVRLYDILDPWIDIYVPDIKWGADDCCNAVLPQGRVRGYLESAVRAVERMARKTRVIVRLLPLPGHFRCCVTQIVRELEFMRSRVWMSFMRYCPPVAGEGGTLPDTLHTPLSLEELQKGIDFLKGRGFRFVEETPVKFWKEEHAAPVRNV